MQKFPLPGPSQLQPDPAKGVAEAEAPSSEMVSIADNQAASASAAQSLARDLHGVADALRYYHEGEVESGDAALQSADPLVHSAVEWVLLRSHPGEAGLERIAAFLRTHADWPAAALRRNAEDITAGADARPDKVLAYFGQFPPTTPAGQVARLLAARGDAAATEALTKAARELWRNSDLSQLLEKKLLDAYGKDFTAADHLARADRMMLREQTGAASRAAQLAGKDATTLFRAEADLANGAPWQKVSARIPASLRDDPALLFERVHQARHAGQIDEAANLLLAAPGASESIGPDEFWVERRLVARKLLDMKDYSRAYRLCVGHAAQGDEARQEAEFHAGWIALRFLNDPALAAPHFEKLAALAHTPHSLARAAYWRGRVAEARGEDASSFYERAAQESETFYGQLARSRSGQEVSALRAPPAAAVGEARGEVVQAAELLFALGEKDAGRQLALDSAHSLPADQMAAMSRVIAAQSDARMALLAGKAAFHRGIVLDELAWPINGLPTFQELARSASRSVVMAIARQESAFDVTAHSGAGAHGLMQMIPGTARNAAKHAGVVYDEARMKNDPAFNAQLGAFHLGELLGEYNGSHILAFAAYNAGGGNVRDWIAAYGDPRSADVDPIDWIERIPFTETRNYVQKIVENLHVYRTRLGDSAPDLFHADLRQRFAARN